MSDASLYERVGGQETIAKLVREMYRRILGDDELAPFFANTPMEKQMRMQTEFFCAALDGPVEYSGLDLAEAHRGLGVTRHHVQKFVEHLLETLRGFDLSDHDVNEICARIGTYVNDVVGESTSDG